MSLTLYACPHLAATGRLNQHTLAVKAAHPYPHYLGYDYFGIYTFDNPSGRRGRTPMTARTSLEWLLRARRTVDFADASGLRPSSDLVSGSLLDVCERILRCDHVTVWIDAWGRTFVLNEPYGDCSDDEASLRDAGLCRTLIPIPLSPYCGGWSDVAGSLPLTRSWLIAHARDKEALDAIAKRLDVAAAKAPAWNDSTGVVLSESGYRAALPVRNRRGVK